MSNTEPPVGGANTATEAARPSSVEAANTAQSATSSWMQMPPIQLIAVFGATVALMTFVWSQVSKTDEKLGKTEDKLTALINERAAGLAADIKEAGNKSNNDVSEARLRFFDAVKLLNDTSEKLGKTATEVSVIRKDMDSTTDKIPALTSSLRTTESKLAETDSKLNTSIDTFDGKLTSITNKIQASKSHEDKYIESFGVASGTFHSGLVNGRIIAFPLPNTAAREWAERSFTRTRARLEATELYAWVPPGRPAGNLPRVLSQSVLTAPLASAPSQ
jgi:hypothetical protein